ncbi:BZ3500-MvSof-1268-A1-R1-Chr1-3g02221 protein [Mycena kentingensis (nom. inval.)]|nr:BZ3500-MvSof-1268-A1-R1-Chr1-3g02221 protein [Mycena kentingensis (nom. inval.)]
MLQNASRGLARCFSSRGTRLKRPETRSLALFWKHYTSFANDADTMKVAPAPKKRSRRLPRPTSPWSAPPKENWTDRSTLSRSLILENIHPDTTRDTVETSLTALSGNTLERMQYWPLKGTAMAVFTSISAAHTCLQKARNRRLWIDTRPIPTGWHPLGPGAPTTSVYIGKFVDMDSFTEERLRADFEPFGRVGSVERLPQKKAAIVNFLQVEDVIHALDGIKLNPDYVGLRISYGKHTKQPSHALYIGFRQGTSTFDETRLREDFAQFGGLEEVRCIPERNCAIIRFDRVRTASWAAERMRADPTYVAAGVEVRQRGILPESARIKVFAKRERREERKRLEQAADKETHDNK